MFRIDTTLAKTIATSVSAASAENDVDPWLVLAVIKVESNWVAADRLVVYWWDSAASAEVGAVIL